MPAEPSLPDAVHIAFGLDVTGISSVTPSLATTFQENFSYRYQQQETADQPKDDDPNEAQACVTLVRQSLTEEPWGEIFRGSFNSEVRHQVFERILGCLKRNSNSIQIHTLEKDLTYLSALSISKKRQLFISFPVSPVSLGILLVIYYAHLFREERDISHTHHAISAKDFVIWIRPQDNGKVSNLRTTRAFNLIEREDTHCALSEKIACLPAYKFEESSQSQRLRVVMVRSLSEAVELFKESQYCSLVVIDDPSGQTYPSPSSYGTEAFKLASLCRQKQIPMVGIVPPWAMRDIEYREKNHPWGILLWPVDFFALRSYPADRGLFANGGTLHPIEESYLLLERKRLSLKEAQVTIKSFNFNTEDEEKISELFQESSALLIDLAKQPQLRIVGVTGWEIWRHLSAPVLPFYLLWGKFIESKLKHLQNTVSKSKDDKALTLYNLLSSLALRLQRLNSNPFIEIIKASDVDTIVAVEDAERANALEKFLGEYSGYSIPQILPLSEIRGFGGKKLIVIGQPKACYRDILQTTFFRHIDVLMWSVLSERAERWWSNLEVDARELHRKTWQILTEKTQVGRYGFSSEYTSVQVVNTGTAKLTKNINISELEESFSNLSGSVLDTGLKNYLSNNLESHYLVEFERGLKIRVAPGSDFLVLSGKKAQVVAVREITAETKVILFDGMTRDELFAQKAGLLEDTKVNYLYRIQLDAWRELVKQQVKKLNVRTVCREILRETGIPIGEETIQYYWINGDDLLSLPREQEHFFWFLPPLARSGFEEFWLKANDLRIKRRQLGQVISACAQEGWKERKSDEIVFQYEQVFITVGELRDAMLVLKVKSKPQMIRQKPEYPINRLFR
ncbi:hypothetical protein [Brasilonema sennae]|uniref:hypothetical protein n=1 Tax=Brasilonema sennae TaxID=1397703 RepID=UPI001C130D99|nr:hypothetical protein [Brasilonema sennae]